MCVILRIRRIYICVCWSINVEARSAIEHSKNHVGQTTEQITLTAANTLRSQITTTTTTTKNEASQNGCIVLFVALLMIRLLYAYILRRDLDF